MSLERDNSALSNHDPDEYVTFSSLRISFFFVRKSSWEVRAQQEGCPTSMSLAVPQPHTISFIRTRWLVWNEPSVSLSERQHFPGTGFSVQAPRHLASPRSKPRLSWVQP